jgi:hypothetical protein
MFTTVHRRAGLAFLLVVTLLVRTSAQRTASAPFEIPIQVISNHVIVPVTVQNRTLSFILDTGAGTSFIDLGVAREMNVALGQSFVATGAGPGGTPGAMLAQPLTATVSAGQDGQGMPAQVRAALDFTALSTHAGRDVDGILGGDFIRRFVLEIDYERLRVRLHDPATFSDAGRGTTLPLTFGAGTGFPHVQATFKVSEQESFPVDCVLDVGSALQVAVTNPVVEARALAEKLSASQLMPIGRGAGGSSDGRLARLPALLLGDITVVRPVAILAGKNAGVLSDGKAFEANIGSGIMRRFTVFFDYGRSRVTFKPNALAAEPLEHDMSGLVLTTEGRPYSKRIIEMVVPGLPGAAAGFKDGDRLKSIDDAAIETLTMDAIRRLFRQDRRTYRIIVERDGKDVTLTLTTRRLV